MPLEQFAIYPQGLPEFAFYFLIAISFATSCFTTAFGIGGGTILLALLANLVPVMAIIPVHGLVQLGSNGSRAILTRSHIDWNILAIFLLGSFIGVIIGASIVVSLPAHILKLVLGLFILYSVWGPKFKVSQSSAHGIAVGGVVTTILTMFVGATGPFVLALLRNLNLSRLHLVATTAACMLAQHLFKAVAFGFLGFLFVDYIVLISLMIVSGFFGTWLGRKVLISSSEIRFRKILDIILSVLALKLLYDFVHSIQLSQLLITT